MYHLPEQRRTIYTIGHSTHSVEDFIGMLHSFDIQLLADIRSFPGSKKFPHFNRHLLEAYLKLAGIGYEHYPDLGGKRKAPAEPPQGDPAYNGYEAYMQTNIFGIAIKQLQYAASKQATAYMCAEAMWWQCHRSKVSDYLQGEGWRVIHIMAKGKMQEHIHTHTPKKDEQGTLF